MLLPSIVKVCVGVLFFIGWLWAYGWTNRYGAGSGAVRRFAPPTVVYPALYQPWMAYIYVAGGLCLPGLPFLFNWSWRGFGRVLSTYVIGSIICFTVYVCYPVAMTRPAYDSGRPGEILMRNVVAVDDPANCLPSAHAYFAVATALLVSRSTVDRRLRILIWFAAVLVAISTVTVGQHYVMDPLAGASVSLISWIVGTRLFPEEKRPSRMEGGN